MNTNWNILNWNVRGLNSKDKWSALSNKIEESGCSILCLQETKRENIDASYIRNFCPKRFNKFEFFLLWEPPVAFLQLGIAISSRVKKSLKINSLSMQFTSVHSGETWILSTIYGPCLHEEKLEFLDWLNNIQAPYDVNWLVLGDFN